MAYAHHCYPNNRPLRDLSSTLPRHRDICRCCAPRQQHGVHVNFLQPRPSHATTSPTPVLVNSESDTRQDVVPWRLYWKRTFPVITFLFLDDLQSPRLLRRTAHQLHRVLSRSWYSEQTGLAYKPKFWARVSSPGCPPYIMEISSEWFRAARAHLSSPARGRSALHVLSEHEQPIIHSVGHTPANWTVPSDREFEILTKEIEQVATPPAPRGKFQPLSHNNRTHFDGSTTMLRQWFWSVHWTSSKCAIPNRAEH